MPRPVKTALVTGNECWIVCLCAQWCRACNDYRAVFSQMANEMAYRFPNSLFVWVDVEDHAALVGDLDIETFPTLLVADSSGLKFLGAVTPQPEILSRLLYSLHQPDAPRREHQPVTREIVEHLAQRPEWRLSSPLKLL